MQRKKTLWLLILLAIPVLGYMLWIGYEYLTQELPAYEYKFRAFLVIILLIVWFCTFRYYRWHYKDDVKRQGGTARGQLAILLYGFLDEVARSEGKATQKQTDVLQSDRREMLHGLRDLAK